MGAVDEGVHVAQALEAGVAVHIAAVAVALPVIAEKVVEQGGAGQRADPVLPQAEPSGKAVGALGGVHGVDIQGVLPAMVGAVL